LTWRVQGVAVHTNNVIVGSSTRLIDFRYRKQKLCVNECSHTAHLLKFKVSLMFQQLLCSRPNCVTSI
jgi:hypothetical protein